MKNEYVVINGTERVLSNAGIVDLIAAVLARGAPFRFRVNGFSMSPFIRDGDVLTLVSTPPRLRKGDVTAFINPSNGRLAVHRIVQLDHSGYLMRGDNNPNPDGILAHSEILGRVISVERSGRRMHFGFGFEGVGIAFLSRYGWLTPLIAPIRFMRNRLGKRGAP